MPARTLAALIAGVIALLPASALAGPMACAPRDDLMTRLASMFHETPTGIGLANNGGLLELLAAPQGATWTVIITMPNGLSCLVAAGESWQERTPPAPEPGKLL